jgi:hypothetical protein
VAANAATTNAAVSTGATPRLAIFFDADRPLQPLQVSRDRSCSQLDAHHNATLIVFIAVQAACLLAAGWNLEFSIRDFFFGIFSPGK